MPVITDKNAGIFKIKINIGEYFGFEHDELFIELKEPETPDVMAISSENGATIDQEKLIKLIPKCIIDHNFLEAEDKPMAVKDFWPLIQQRSGCTLNIVTIFMNEIPLNNLKQTKSEE